MINSTETLALNYDIPEIEKHTENEGIGFLVNMAKAGKIDPWNINISSTKR